MFQAFSDGHELSGLETPPFAYWYLKELEKVKAFATEHGILPTVYVNAAVQLVAPYYINKGLRVVPIPALTQPWVMDAVQAQREWFRKQGKDITAPKVVNEDDVHHAENIQAELNFACGYIRLRNQGLEALQALTAALSLYPRPIEPMEYVETVIRHLLHRGYVWYNTPIQEVIYDGFVKGILDEQSVSHFRGTRFIFV